MGGRGYFCARRVHGLRQRGAVHGVGETQRQPEDVEREIAQRALALGRHMIHLARVEAGDEPLRGLQHAVQARRQLGRREARGRAVVDAEQGRIAVRVPAVHDTVAEGDAGRARDAESDHLLARADVRLDVDGVELDPPRREQLLRLGAGGSAGAGVEARLHRVHYTRCAMAPQRPLYHRFAWAFDLVVPDASAARVRRLAALLRAAGVRPPARILDAGCGTGHYAPALARRGYRVVGVDRSARLLADARAKGAGTGLVFARADLP